MDKALHKLGGRSPQTVLVAGATGRFGSLVGLLLERGYEVRAMTRDPSSESGRRLRKAGAEVVFGDLDEPSSIAGALAGADAMFGGHSAQSRA